MKQKDLHAHLEQAHVLDSAAHEVAPRAFGIPHEVYAVLYPRELPRKLSYVFKYKTPVQMPAIEAKSFIDRHPALVLTDSLGNEIKPADDGFETQVEYEIGDLDKMKAPELKEWMKRFRITIPFGPANVTLVKLIKEAILAATKPLTDKGLEDYEQFLKDEKAREKAAMEVKKKNTREAKSVKMKAEAPTNPTQMTDPDADPVEELVEEEA